MDSMGESNLLGTVAATVILPMDIATVIKDSMAKSYLPGTSANVHSLIALPAAHQNF